MLGGARRGGAPEASQLLLPMKSSWEFWAVHDAAAGTQAHFTGHTDDVLGIAVHRQRRLVASGQKSYREGGRMRKPTIWARRHPRLSSKGARGQGAPQPSAAGQWRRCILVIDV